MFLLHLIELHIKSNIKSNMNSAAIVGTVIRA